MSADNRRSVELPCMLCEEPVLPTDDMPPTRFYDEFGRLRRVHRECALRSMLGGIGHHRDHERWCVELGDPDGGLSYRDSARLVARMVDDGTLRLDQ